MKAIAAIATPPGNGGIGIVRISGNFAGEILNGVFKSSLGKSPEDRPWRLMRGLVMDEKGEPLDEALAVYMPGPKTFTGENVAEIHCHGGMAIVEAVLASVLTQGATLARHGEFTRRAFLNGRLDLSQAEAVAEMIAAPGRQAMAASLKRLRGALGETARELRAHIEEARQMLLLALDFPEEETPPTLLDKLVVAVNAALAGIINLLNNAKAGRLFQEGAKVVLAGSVNAGKSSIFNALYGQNRSIVTALPGTTRDYISEKLLLDDLPVTLYDTAGLRSTAAEPIEELGMARTRELLHQANLAVYILDGANPASLENNKTLTAILGANIPVLLVWNKCDLSSPWRPEILENFPFCAASARTGENMDKLAKLIRETLLRDAPCTEGALAPNQRQAKELAEARAELEALLSELAQGMPLDCASARLDCAAQALDNTLGLAATPELLDKIFSRFCIGK